MTKTVLTTRALADAAEDIAFLQAQGITAIAAPMLEIHASEIVPATLPRDINAIAFTSRNAPRHLMAATDSFRDTPAYCVGEATAGAAEAAGFTNTVYNDNDHDGAALARRIITTKPKHILWPSGVHYGFDLEAALTDGGIPVSRIPVYEARKTDGFPDTALAAIREGAGAIVLVHSGRAAENLARLMDANAISPDGIDLIAVSPKAAGLCGAGWHTITVPDTPDRAAMLEAASAKAAVRQAGTR